MPGRGVEPPCLSALPPQGNASAVSPPGQILDQISLSYYAQILFYFQQNRLLFRDGFFGGGHFLSGFFSGNVADIIELCSADFFRGI